MKRYLYAACVGLIALGITMFVGTILWFIGKTFGGFAFYSACFIFVVWGTVGFINYKGDKDE